MKTGKTLCIALLLAGSVSSCGPMAVGNYRVHSAGMAKPKSFESFPHTTYKDRDAYLVGSEWFFYDSTYGLVVFEDVPPELRAYGDRALAFDTHGKP
jgi:hypothetical protein